MSKHIRTQLALELEQLKSCIHCGFCLPACPTYRATGSEAESPRGRLYLMKKLLEEQATVAEVTPHLDHCLACHGCETVCPSGVQYGHILLGTREALAPRRSGWRRRFKRWAFSRLLPWHAGLLGLGRLLRFYQQSGLQNLVRRSPLFKLLPALAGQDQLLPKVPRHKPIHAGTSFGNPSGDPVVLLVGCVMDVFYNPVHWDTIDVLVANGFYVRIPEQTCCGALAHHAGEADITRALARRNIDTILEINPKWIVVNSAGCGSTMQDYGQLLKEDPAYADRAAVFAQKTIDVMALLAQRPLAKFRRPLEQTVTYHAACHLHHVQQVKSQPLDVLKQIPGLRLVPLENAEACCGSAGIYNVEHVALSAEILTEKMRHLHTACTQGGAQTVVTGNPGCMLQLQKGVTDAGLSLQVAHPVSLLASAYRSPDHAEA